jgi:lysozyme family protein
MSATNFRIWVKTELVFEGGKVNHPADLGGKTNMGVTQRVYNGYRKARSQPTQDVYAIAAAEVADIYKTGYWDKVWGDRLPEGLDVVVADGAINSGVSQSVKWLQRALGVRVDGIMGDATLTAASSIENTDALIAKVCNLRLAFLRALKTFRTFGKGWTRRVDQLRGLGQKLAFGDVGPNPTAGLQFVANMNRKASLEDAKAAPPKLDALWGAGTGTGALAQATAALEPLQGITVVSKMLTIVTVLGVLLAVGGGIWAWYARQRTAKLNDALNIRPETPANENADVELAPKPELPAGIEDLAEAA